MLVKAHFNIPLSGTIWLATAADHFETPKARFKLGQTDEGYSGEIELLPSDGDIQFRKDQRMFPYNTAKIQLERTIPDGVGVAPSFPDEFLSAAEEAQRLMNNLFSVLRHKYKQTGIRRLHLFTTMDGLTFFSIDDEEVQGLQFSHSSLDPPPFDFFRPVPENEMKTTVWSVVDCGLSIGLVDEIMADSIAAFQEGNLRRSIIEAAVACEAAVKSRFYDKVADYLDSKNELRVRVLDLISKVAEGVYGISFREDHPSEFTCIDHLFRARNQAAHRGEAKYRDDDLEVHTVGQSHLVIWIAAVECLLGWLEELESNAAK